MTKNFDEGGAKGLLLANLGVSTKGCNIVFDSTLEEPEPQQDPESKDSDDRTSSTAAGTIDISTLQASIKAALGGQSLDQLPLVPQLAMLREEYRELDKHGFLDPQLPTVSSQISLPSSSVPTLETSSCKDMHTKPNT